jgi:DNA-binding NarL/FixJ family response regulator/class 3 adenylate cyclase
VSELPSGTVTFLFADLEGSTQLVQQLGGDYSRMLNDTRRLIRAATKAHGGHEIDCRGDELFVVFQDADDAVATAVDVQRSFAGHGWPQDARVRARIGIHTGQPTIEEDGYVGLDVHRVARIANAGHGGQVLLSASARALLPGVAARDLGDHRLAGLVEPEHLFQLEAAEIEREFPPLRWTESASAMRVVIADDSVLLREGVARLLGDGGFDVVAQSGTADDLLRHVGMHGPDVAIIDIRMPPTHTDEGLRAAQTIRQKHPDVGVLVLSQYVEPGYAMELLADNAEGVGYLLKDRVADVDEFTAAVRRVAEGGSALDPAVVSELVGRRRREDPLGRLTPREREVLGLMAEGRSNQAIAERMFVTLRAVEKHVTSIFTKLGLPAAEGDHRRVLAVLAFLGA